MGVIKKEFGEIQPICNDCGIALCWSIEEFEYNKNPKFWDNWCCKECNPDYRKLKLVLDI